MAFKVLQWIPFILLKLLQECSSQSLHAPANVIWEVKSATTSRPAARVTNRTTPFTWWPDLMVDLCDLARGSWDIGDWTTSDGRPECNDPTSTDRRCKGLLQGYYDIGCGHPIGRFNLHFTPFYVCPGFNRTSSKIITCGGVTDFFCAAWGCEETGTVYWKTNPPPYSLIQVSMKPWEENKGNRCQTNFTCNTLSISFTSQGRKFKQWDQGVMWGLRLYQTGYDNGVLFTITQKVEHILT